jgi:DNA modification methylase
VSKEYDEDLTLDEYRELLRRVLRETHRVLVDGGRACVNEANIGRKPYIPIHAFLTEDMIELGFAMRGEVIWNKGGECGTIHRVGKLEISNKSDATRCSRVHPHLFRRQLCPKRSRKKEHDRTG